MLQARHFSSLSCFLLLYCSLVGALPRPAPTATHNVLSYGAVGDGRTHDTEAFLAAWNATCSDTTGRPRMRIPKGKTFMVGHLQLWGPCKSPVHVRVNGNLVRPNEHWYDEASWIQVSRVDDLTIDGRGQLDGTGQFYWNCKLKRTCKVGPNNLVLLSMRNLDVSGLRSVNSSQFHMVIGWSDTVSLHNLNIKAPQDAPNTDGIFISASNNVRIGDTIIGTGDDCVAIGNGSMNVNVNNVTCGPGHGISVGSLGKRNGEAKVENITITNSMIFDADNGLRIKTWPGGSGYARNIRYRNIKVQNVFRPIIIDQFYCPFQYCRPASSDVKISDVEYINVRGTTMSQHAVTFNCSASVPCKRIHMNTVGIRPFKGNNRAGQVATATSTCSNAYGTSEGTVVPKVPCLKST